MRRNIGKRQRKLNMNKYRIIKRKNSVFKDQDEYVVQQEVWNQYSQRNVFLGSGVEYSPTYWSNLGTFPTLGAAMADKHKRETGLNPGEEIVG